MWKATLISRSLNAFAVQAALVPSCYAQATTDSLYAKLESISDDLAALHNIRAPSWVSAPKMRGTSNILYSCLLTLIACVYTALHLNVPKNGTGFNGLLKTKLLWCFTALIAPEIVLFYATSQFFNAKKLSKDLRTLQAEEEAAEIAPVVSGQVPIRDVQAQNEGPDKVGVPAAPEATRSPDCKFGLKYGFFVVMGGFQIWYHDPLGDTPGATLRTLSPDGVRKLAAQNLNALKISRSSIEDRSKADTIQKGFVLLQVGWMALQCIARKAYGLPLALLEVHTMVHVVCAIIMYAFWLKKPLDLRSTELVDYAKFNHIELASDADFYPPGTNLPGFKLSWLIRFNIKEIVNRTFDMVEYSAVFLLFFILGLPIIYGGVHLSAWNFEFPTMAESLIWKISCLVIAWAIPSWYIISFLIRILLGMPGGVYEDIATYIISFLAKLFTAIYILCRLYIVVEAFVSLRSVPIGVYWTPAWIQMIPHV